VRNRNKTLLAVTLLSLLHPAEVGARTAYDDALDKYRAGLFQQAANGFSAAAVQEPSKQVYHYLLANCLVHLEQHKRAQEEYKVAYVLDPQSSTGEFCRQALLAYKKPVPQTVASDSAHAGVVDTSELARVKQLISKQANSEKDKHDLLAARGEMTVQSHMDEELRRVDEWMQSELQHLNDPIVYNPGPRANPLLANPELMKQREDQIRATAQAERDRIKKEASGRSQGYESWRKDRDALLDEAAGNLQRQLDQPVGRSGVKLQAHGTGLYVRYYGKGGTNYLPDPHQATARIGDAAALNNGSEDGSGTDSGLAASARPAAAVGAKDVKGKLMKDSTKPGSFNVQGPLL
jgi:hypothetical protein